MKWIFYCLLLANMAYFGYQMRLSDTSAQSTEKTSQKDVGPEVASASGPPAILLLSEHQGRSDRDLEVEQVLENPITAPAQGQAGAAGCAGLGPFADVISGQNVAERFNAAGFAVVLRAVDVPTGEFDYRVIMPPFASLQEAFRRLRELKSREIDSYVITQGEDSLGISLGVFSTRQFAEEHQRRLVDDGYAVSIRTIPRVNRGYWLFAETSADFPAELLGAITEEFTMIDLTETACLN